MNNLPITAKAADYKALDQEVINGLSLQEVREALNPANKWEDETKANLYIQLTRKMDEMITNL